MLVEPIHTMTKTTNRIEIDLVSKTSINVSPTSDSTQPQSKPNVSIPLDLAPFILFIPSGFPNLDSFITYFNDKITKIRKMNAQNLDPNEVFS